MEGLGSVSSRASRAWKARKSGPVAVTSQRLSCSGAKGAERPVPVHPLCPDPRRVQVNPEVHLLPGAVAGLPEPHLGGMSSGLIPERTQGRPALEPQLPQRGRDVPPQHPPVGVLRRPSHVHFQPASMIALLTLGTVKDCQRTANRGRCCSDAREAARPDGSIRPDQGKYGYAAWGSNPEPAGLGPCSTKCKAPPGRRTRRISAKAWGPKPWRWMTVAPALGTPRGMYSGGSARVQHGAWK